MLGLQGVPHLPEAVRIAGAVRVQKTDQFPRSLTESFLDGGPVAPVRLEHDDPDRGVSSRELASNLGRAVRRTIADHDHLDVADLTRPPDPWPGIQTALDRRADALLLVEGGNHD